MVYLDGIIEGADLFKDGKVFAKGLEGSGGSEVVCLKNNDELNKLKQLWKNKNYILQEEVKQHEAMSKISPSSINTIRIVTVLGEGNPYILSSFARFGTKASGFVDNIAQGGYGIGVNGDGTLPQYAFYKTDNLYKKTEKHIYTNFKFLDFKIPYYKEALEAVF